MKATTTTPQPVLTPAQKLQVNEMIDRLSAISRNNELILLYLETSDPKYLSTVLKN